jgi:HSP20 family protein
VTPSRGGYVEELARLRERLQAVLQEALLRSPFAGGAGAPPGSWAPSADVVETDAAFVLSIELPGVDRDAVELTAPGEGARRLEVSGHRPLPPDASFARMERSYGGFRRVCDLPAPGDVDGISGELRRGVLTVVAPKKPTSRTVAVDIPGEIPSETEGETEGD